MPPVPLTQVQQVGQNRGKERIVMRNEKSTKRGPGGVAWVVRILASVGLGVVFGAMVINGVVSSYLPGVTRKAADTNTQDMAADTVILKDSNIVDAVAQVALKLQGVGAWLQRVAAGSL